MDRQIDGTGRIMIHHVFFLRFGKGEARREWVIGVEKREKIFSGSRWFKAKAARIYDLMWDIGRERERKEKELFVLFFFFSFWRYMPFTYFSFVHSLSFPLKALFLFEDLSVVKYCVLTIVIRKTLNWLWVVGDVIRELFFDFGVHFHVRIERDKRERKKEKPFVVWVLGFFNWVCLSSVINGERKGCNPTTRKGLDGWFQRKQEPCCLYALVKVFAAVF